MIIFVGTNSFSIGIIWPNYILVAKITVNHVFLLCYYHFIGENLFLQFYY